MTVRRVALMGFGNVAEHGHLPAWRRRDDVQIVAVADVDPVRRALAARLLPVARVYPDASALLQREQPDIVDIATPPALHVPFVVEAAAAGCHILCEKPLATAVADYRRAARAVAASGVTLFTVHNWKHSAQFARVSALLAEGAVGRVRHIRLETIRNGWSVAVGGAWRSRAALAGGGILVDHGWHAFYLLTSLAGERPRRISATLERRRYTKTDVEDTARCTVEFPSMTGEIRLTWAGAERRTRWRVSGERGSLELDQGRLELRRGPEILRFVFRDSLSASSHHPEWFGAVIDAFVREIEDQAIRGENLAEAESCLMLLSLAYASGARGGRALRVPRALMGIRRIRWSGSGAGA